MPMRTLVIPEKDSEMADKSNKHEANAQFAKLQRANDAKLTAIGLALALFSTDLIRFTKAPILGREEL